MGACACVKYSCALHNRNPDLETKTMAKVEGRGEACHLPYWVPGSMDTLILSSFA